MTFTPYDEQTDKELADRAGVQGGTHIEAMRRLRVAVEKQSRASGRLTWAIIALMIVQIVIAGAQVWIALAIVKVRQ